MIARCTRSRDVVTHCCHSLGDSKENKCKIWLYTSGARQRVGTGVQLHPYKSHANFQQSPRSLAFARLKLLLHRQTTYTTSYDISRPDLGIVQTQHLLTTTSKVRGLDYTSLRRIGFRQDIII